MRGPRYAELQVTSHFSFLRGASSCEELFATAAILGVGALAVVAWHAEQQRQSLPTFTAWYQQRDIARTILWLLCLVGIDLTGI
jgi:hypothetical protein